jgi:hypothetical protein
MPRFRISTHSGRESTQKGHQSAQKYDIVTTFVVCDGHPWASNPPCCVHFVLCEFQSPVSKRPARAILTPLHLGAILHSRLCRIFESRVRASKAAHACTPHRSGQLRRLRRAGFGAILHQFTNARDRSVRPGWWARGLAIAQSGLECDSAPFCAVSALR